MSVRLPLLVFALVDFVVHDELDSTCILLIKVSGHENAVMFGAQTSIDILQVRNIIQKDFPKLVEQL